MVRFPHTHSDADSIINRVLILVPEGGGPLPETSTHRICRLLLRNQKFGGGGGGGSLRPACLLELPYLVSSSFFV